MLTYLPELQENRLRQNSLVHFTDCKLLKIKGAVELEHNSFAS